MSAFPTLQYERDWTNPVDFPTWVEEEKTVREDLQYHPNAVKAYLNEILLPAIENYAMKKFIGTPSQLVGFDANGEPVSVEISEVTGITPEGIRAIPEDARAVPGGVATLGEDGLLVSEQHPGYAKEDTLSGDTKAALGLGSDATPAAVFAKLARLNAGFANDFVWARYSADGVLVDYVNSADGAAYPPAESDGYTYEPLGQVGTRMLCASGSYTGNGLVGSENPNVLQFQFNPKLLIICPLSGGEPLVIANGVTTMPVPYPTSRAGWSYGSRWNITWGERSVSWWADGITSKDGSWSNYEDAVPNGQWNKTGDKFTYFVFG